MRAAPALGLLQDKIMGPAGSHSPAQGLNRNLLIAAPGSSSRQDPTGILRGREGWQGHRHCQGLTGGCWAVSDEAEARSCWGISGISDPKGRAVLGLSHPRFIPAAAPGVCVPIQRQRSSQPHWFTSWKSLLGLRLPVCK